MIVCFALLNFSSFCLLIGLKKPLVIVLFELSDIRMILLFCYLDALIPSVQLLIHSHSFFDLIVLDEDSLSFMELLFKDSQLGLHSKVIESFRHH